MKRAALERLHSVRVWRRHAEISGLVGHTYSELHPGHFRKGRRAGGCSNTACWLCHSAKLGDIPTMQESRHWLSYREQLADASR
jgi:hypothetical protein